MHPRPPAPVLRDPSGLADLAPRAAGVHLVRFDLDVVRVDLFGLLEAALRLLNLAEVLLRNPSVRQRCTHSKSLSPEPEPEPRDRAGGRGSCAPCEKRGSISIAASKLLIASSYFSIFINKLARL